MRPLSKSKATLVGVLAILLWSALVSLLRGVGVSFGAVGGAALSYSVATALLWFTVGFPKLREFPRAYLASGSVLFVSYELCLSLSIGYAHDAKQAVEVSMLNYLWPTFTMVAAIVFNRQRATLLIVPGFLLSMAGIVWILSGGQGLSALEVAKHVSTNPWSYGLAFTGALLWAAYCTVTARFAEGRNGVTWFFLLVAVVLWLKYLLADDTPPMTFTPRSIVTLALAAASLGFGYAAWNVGILHGHVTLLAGASYFIPVLSAALAAALLQAPLTTTFWQGTLAICVGSLVCWLATRRAQRKGEGDRYGA